MLHAENAQRLQLKGEKAFDEASCMLLQTVLACCSSVKTPSSSSSK